MHFRAFEGKHHGALQANPPHAHAKKSLPLALKVIKRFQLRANPVTEANICRITPFN
jgi:hypothetical protein